MSDIYARSTEVAKELSTEIGREFQNCFVTLRFDELNVAKARSVVEAMYKRVDKKFRALCLEIAEDAYKQASGEIEKPANRYPTALFVSALLKDYNPTTEYVYENEWGRKADRLVEALMSCKTRNAMRDAYRRSKKLLQDQVAQYSDIVTDEARMKAFTDAGFTEFMWNAQQDDKVCEECESRDGQIYTKDNIPTKHYGCRCYLTAVI